MGGEGRGGEHKCEERGGEHKCEERGRGLFSEGALTICSWPCTVSLDMEDTGEAEVSGTANCVLSTSQVSTAAN